MPGLVLDPACVALAELEVVLGEAGARRPCQDPDAPGPAAAEENP